MIIRPEKIEQVNERLLQMGVSEADLHEEFIRGSGAGGQKINKTNSCVQLTYLKKGWVFRSQDSRSREANRFFARRKLLEKLENERLGSASTQAKKIHKIRAQKRKRSKRAKEKMLNEKSHHAKIKSQRQKVRVTQ